MNLIFVYEKIKSLFITIPVYITLFICLSGLLFCQEDNFMMSVFSSADIKKLDKAKDYEIQAEVLIEEANELYMETFAVQGNYELDEKAIDKKVKQLESKAQKKQTEAAQYYSLINSTKFGIYKRYIEKFWSDYEGDESGYVNAKLIEEQSNDYYFQAANLRTEASKTQDEKEKVEQLNNAYELEIKALEKQLSALSIYYGIEYTAPDEYVEPVAVYTEEPQEIVEPPEIEEPYAEPVQQDIIYEDLEIPKTGAAPVAAYVPAVTSISQLEGDIRINQMIIDIYNNYMADESRQPANVLTPEMITGLTSFDADQILNIWYSYAYDTLYEGVPEQPQELLATAGMASEEAESADQQMYISSEEELVPSEYEEKIAVVEEAIGESYHIPADEEVIYRVQIAANKAQLSQRALSKIYYGNKNVEMINEENWFKYSVGDFDEYEEASKFRKQCGVENAFIVAYRKGTRFSPSRTDVAGIASAGEADEGMISSKFDVGLSFRVQVAANRVPVTKEQLERIYIDDYPVEMIYEDDWYKYQLLGVRLFSDALKILRRARVKGAFIIAYNNGTMQNLYTAAKFSKTVEKEVQTYGRKGKLNDVEWHVQIAASKIPLNQSELAGIYKGNQDVSLIIEEGWYKYRLKAGTSYSAAREIKESCGVNRTFIVAYYVGKKVPIQNAIYDF